LIPLPFSYDIASTLDVISSPKRSIQSKLEMQFNFLASSTNFSRSNLQHPPRRSINHSQFFLPSIFSVFRFPQPISPTGHLPVGTDFPRHFFLFPYSHLLASCLTLLCSRRYLIVQGTISVPTNRGFTLWVYCPFLVRTRLSLRHSMFCLLRASVMSIVACMIVFPHPVIPPTSLKHWTFLLPSCVHGDELRRSWP